jgi:hypothetical protein
LPFDLSFSYNIPPPSANEEELFLRIKEDGKTRALVFLVSEFVVEPSPSYSRSSVYSRIRRWVLDRQTTYLQPISHVHNGKLKISSVHAAAVFMLWLLHVADFTQYFF